MSVVRPTKFADADDTMWLRFQSVIVQMIETYGIDATRIQLEQEVARIREIGRICNTKRNKT